MSGHHHDHAGHSHGHHHHAPPGGAHNRAFALAVVLNIGFVAAEVSFGLASGSMALLADAAHNLGDVLALLLSWGASILAQRPPSPRYTYGLKSSSILAAMANAALLWATLGMIVLETIQRMGEPEHVNGSTMMVVATIGIAINAASALLFASGSKSDLNLRAAFQHLMADAAVSAGVVIAGFLVILTGKTWIDPITSLLICAVIALTSWSLLRDSVKMGLLAVPAEIDEAKVRQFLSGQPGVSALHDLHIWPMSTTETALTAHLEMPCGTGNDQFLHHMAHELEHQFGIGHVTIQIETGISGVCALADDHAV